MRKLKKLISIAICLAMVLSMVPTAFAAEGDVFVKVTDVSQLAVGDQVIIVSDDADNAMSNYQKSNNRGAIAISKSGDEVTELEPNSYGDVLQILTLEAGVVEGTFAFNTGSGYLYAASSSGNYLRTETTLSANSSWKITIADGATSVVAQGSNTRATMQYNPNTSNGSPLFACYTGATQGAISLYKLETGESEGNTPEVPTPDVPVDENALVLGNNELIAGSRVNSEYTFTAAQTGTLYLTVRNYTCNDVEYGEMMFEYNWSQIFVNGVALSAAQTTLEVAAGDVLNIVMTCDGDTYVANLFLSFEGFYEEPAGTEFNPIKLTPDECPTTTPEIPAGGEVYYALDNAMEEHVLYVYGENAYIAYKGWNDAGAWTDIYVYAVDGVVTYPVWQYEIRIGNAGDTAATFELDAELPVGLETNPDTLVIGENVTAMSADLWGYYYTWTAPEAGSLTVTVTGDSSWAFMLQNADTTEEYYYFESSEDPNTATIAVNAGDTVILMLRLFELVDWESIDGTLTATAEFTPAGGSEDPTLGTEENPMEVVFEMNETYTVGTASVTMPAGETVYYYAYGVGGMILTVTDADGNVVKTETLPGNPRMPVYFNLTNPSEAEETYTLTVTYPAGTMNNPAELVLGYNEVAVSGNGYFYTWTAEEDTLFVLSMQSDNWTYCINIVGADGSYVYGDTRYSGEAAQIPVTVVKLSAGDTVELSMGTADWTEATVAFTAYTYAGTESDPVVLNFTWNGMGTAASLNADLPAGEYVYTLPIYGESNLKLYVNGEQTEYTVVDPMGWDPNVVTINNETGMNAVYTLELKGPAGTQANPDTLELGYVESEMIFADYQLAHWYSFTAEADTLLVLSMLSDDWYYWGMYIDSATGYPAGMLEGHGTDADVLVPVQVIKLAAGETIWLCFGTIDGAETVEFTAYTYAGTESDPAVLNFTWNGMGTAASLNADLPAGEYVYTLPIYGESNLKLYVNGEQTEYTVVDPMGWDPNVVTINNETDMNAVYTLELKGPAGTQANPDTLELGYVESEMIFADYQLAHWYSFTAEADTLLVLSMLSDDWYYWGMYIDSATGYPAGMLEGHSTDADVLVPVQVIKLAAGETIWLCFGTIDGAETVEFTAYTYAGTAEDPALIDFAWNEAGTSAAVNVDLPAGEYVYGARGISGTILTVNGVETEIIPGMGMRYPETFVINNTEETNAVFALELSYPEGTWTNPDEAVEGENVARVEADNFEGYFFTWTAPANGTLTVTVSSNGGWFFVINNETSGAYGDGHFSDDMPVVNPEVIEVKAGDVIQIVVNAYDPENGLGVAGEITVDLAFTAATVEVVMGDVNGDGLIDTTDAKLIMQYDLGLVDEAALDLTLADVNGDGLVDTTDAKLIMQLDLGIITEFPNAD